ncbi:Hypothetical predicted protein [Marmota monax]|uniref:Uncharacterized protein n=1 Tax=Marmota monax TaxID=9995 RepID=A0A5E4BZZ6_MARMO|nr:hypothetical protein GHT09_017580 [Marmota monax]VTJ75193.1 Hypothetical predicted protein [Marmota monax]
MREIARPLLDGSLAAVTAATAAPARLERNCEAEGGDPAKGPRAGRRRPGAEGRCQRVMPVSPGSLLMSCKASALPHSRAAPLHPRGLLAPPRSPLCSTAPA